MKKHPSQSHQKILQAYQQNLHQVVGLSPKTCQDRFRDVRRFLEAVLVRRVGDLAKLTPVHLVSYLTARSADYKPASLRNVASPCAISYGLHGSKVGPMSLWSWLFPRSPVERTTTCLFI